LKTTFIFVLLLAGASLPADEPKPIHKLTRPELEARLQSDTRAVRSHRDGLRAVVSFVESRPDLFPAVAPKESRLRRREEKAVVWSTWQRFLDYLVALDSVEQYHAGFHRLRGTAREDSFLVGYAAMLAKYRAVLEFISPAENNPELDKVLNDPVPELGLPAGTYGKLKFKYLNVAIATDFVAHEAVMKTLSGGRQPALREAIRADADSVWQAGQGRGEMLTAKNGLEVLQGGAQSARWAVRGSEQSLWVARTPHT
jgi:hypothetical protein